MHSTYTVVLAEQKCYPCLRRQTSSRQHHKLLDISPTRLRRATCENFSRKIRHRAARSRYLRQLRDSSPKRTRRAQLRVLNRNRRPDATSPCHLHSARARRCADLRRIILSRPMLTSRTHLHQPCRTCYEPTCTNHAAHSRCYVSRTHLHQPCST